MPFIGGFGPEFLNSYNLFVNLAQDPAIYAIYLWISGILGGHGEIHRSSHTGTGGVSQGGTSLYVMRGPGLP